MYTAISSINSCKREKYLSAFIRCTERNLIKYRIYYIVYLYCDYAYIS